MMNVRLDRFGNGWKRNFWTRAMKRFGGGWRWKLGIAIGGRSVLIHVLIGTIRIDF